MLEILVWDCRIILSIAPCGIPNKTIKNNEPMIWYSKLRWLLKVKTDANA